MCFGLELTARRKDFPHVDPADLGYSAVHSSRGLRPPFRSGREPARRGEAASSRRRGRVSIQSGARRARRRRHLDLLVVGRAALVRPRPPRSPLQSRRRPPGHGDRDSRRAAVGAGRLRRDGRGAGRLGDRRPPSCTCAGSTPAAGSSLSARSKPTDTPNWRRSPAGLSFWPGPAPSRPLARFEEYACAPTLSRSVRNRA